MKVLHILYQSLPNISGSSIRSRDILHNQLKLGIEPIVITSPFQKSLNNGESVEEINGIKYYRTFSNINETVSERNSSFFLQIKKLLRIVKFTYQVYRIAKVERVDIIHAHSMFFCAISGKITSFILKKPLIYEVRSLWEERYKKDNFFNHIIFSLITYLETFSMFFSDYIIAINQNLKTELQKRFLLKNKKITVVKNAVDLNRVVESQIKRNELVFGYIGTLSPIEGLDLLIKAFKNLDISNELLIFGSGIEHENLKKLSKDNNNIKFRGKVSSSEIFNEYNQIDIIVNPRKKNYLTDSVTPLKTIEAMAYKKLVIASDVGGMKELIKDGENGILFKSDSVFELEKVINDILKKAKISDIKENAYKYILKKRSWFENAKLYKRLYNDLRNEN